MDIWDLAALAGVVCLITGVGLWSIPAALVTFGGGLLAVYYLRERGLDPQSHPREPE